MIKRGNGKSSILGCPIILLYLVVPSFFYIGFSVAMVDSRRVSWGTTILSRTYDDNRYSWTTAFRRPGCFVDGGGVGWGGVGHVLTFM